MNVVSDILRLLDDGPMPENVVYNKLKQFDFMVLQCSIAALIEHRLIEYCFESLLCITEAGRKEIR